LKHAFSSDIQILPQHFEVTKEKQVSQFYCVLGFI